MHIQKNIKNNLCCVRQNKCEFQVCVTVWFYLLVQLVQHLCFFSLTALINKPLLTVLQ
jgi:hypothetical protein